MLATNCHVSESKLSLASDMVPDRDVSKRGNERNQRARVAGCGVGVGKRERDYDGARADSSTFMTAQGPSAQWWAASCCERGEQIIDNIPLG